MIAKFDRLKEQPNVDYIGVVPHANVPEIITAFDVALIPFRVSAYTRAVNPVKLYEYAAQNVSVISTAFSPDLDEFEDWINICGTAEQFISAVSKALDTCERRDIRWIAEGHAWGAVAAELTSLISGDAQYQQKVRTSASMLVPLGPST
jgi:glycosyltransferase involved in cell wall biosynthesis